MTRKIKDAVIVITGASSGIGRATALAFAERGGTVVVAARSEEALHQLVTECERLGGRGLAVPTDVTDEEAVKNLARRAIKSFGRIDVWVNNAAVSLFGRFEESPSEPYRRVIETNLFGYIHGARSVLPYFREQGSGVLINVASVVGKVAQPYASAYTVTKFAVVGLSQSLRQELLDAKNIHVCAILPAAIDTPLFQHAANFTGRAVKPINPVYDARTVAEAIVGCAEKPRREVTVGSAGRMLKLTRRLTPGLAERMLARQVEHDHFQDQPAPPTEGNLFQPMPQYTGISGGWRENGGASAGRATVGALAGLGAGVLAWRWYRASQSRNGAVKQMARRVPGLARVMR